MTADGNERARIIQQKSDVSAKISETCRYIGFGLVALYYATKVGDSAFTIVLREHQPFWIFLVGLMGALTILSDYLQYFCGYWSAENALKRDPPDYDSESEWYRARRAFFYTKQGTALVGAVALVVLIYQAGP